MTTTWIVSPPPPTRTHQLVRVEYLLPDETGERRPCTSVVSTPKLRDLIGRVTNLGGRILRLVAYFEDDLPGLYGRRAEV